MHKHTEGRPPSIMPVFGIKTGRTKSDFNDVSDGLFDRFREFRIISEDVACNLRPNRFAFVEEFKPGPFLAYLRSYLSLSLFPLLT